jgi:ABC-type polysaccharide/polyol phosphate export permease
MLGSMLWGIFAKSLTGVMQGFSSGSSVFVKIRCSPLAFSFSGLSQVFFDLFLQCLLLVPVFFVFDIKFSSYTLLAPLGMLGLSLLGSAFGLLFIHIQVCGICS